VNFRHFPFKISALHIGWLQATQKKKSRCCSVESCECECKLLHWRIWSTVPLAITVAGAVLLSACAPSIWPGVTYTTGILLCIGFLAGFFLEHTPSVRSCPLSHGLRFLSPRVGFTRAYRVMLSVGRTLSFRIQLVAVIITSLIVAILWEFPLVVGDATIKPSSALPIDLRVRMAIRVFSSIPVTMTHACGPVCRHRPLPSH